MLEVIMRMNRERILSLIPHIIGLFFVTIIPMFIFDASDVKIKFWTYRFYYQLFFLIIAFYGNYLFITPKYLFSNKKVKFFLTLLIFTVVLLSISQIASKRLEFIQPPARVNNQRLIGKRVGHENMFGLHPRILDDTFFLILIFGFSTGMSILQKLRGDDQKKQKLEKVNIENELAFLKNQISPHFFFNSLNNIYALIDIDSVQAQKTIETLSGLMRYLLYETKKKQQSLEKEIICIQNYLDLERIRFGDLLEIDMKISGDIVNKKIAPMLLLSFVENAFKHGANKNVGTIKIDIDFKLLENFLYFTISNPTPKITKHKQNIDSFGGIGLKNAKKRLALGYKPDEYNLSIDTKNNRYVVHLKIKV